VKDVQWGNVKSVKI